MQIAHQARAADVGKIVDPRTNLDRIDRIGRNRQCAEPNISYFAGRIIAAMEDRPLGDEAIRSGFLVHFLVIEVDRDDVEAGQ